MKTSSVSIASIILLLFSSSPAACMAQSAATQSAATQSTATQSAATQPGVTLARVRARGVLLCGIDRSEAEYSSTDEHGSRVVFDLDLCKAVAVALLGQGAAVRATYYADDVTSRQALTAGKVDLVASLSTDLKDSGQEEAASIGFTAPVLYDAVGLMVLRGSGVRSAPQLSSRKICFLTETRVEDRLHLWFSTHHLDLLPFPFQEEGEMEAAFVTRNCTALGGDLTRLAQTRASTGSQAQEYEFLPEAFGDDPLAMAYRLDDPQWKAAVDGIRDLLVGAAAQGLTAAKVSAKDFSLIGDAYPCLARADQLGMSLSLSRSWSGDVLHSIGNYNEVFERDVGKGSALNLPSAAGALSRRDSTKKQEQSNP